MVSQHVDGIPAETLAGLTQTGCDRSVAVLLRHAERGPLPPGEPGDGVPITERGQEAARLLGRRCTDRLVTIHTSPVLRCVQTAEAISVGAESEVQIVHDRYLGDPGVFVADPTAAWVNWQRLGDQGMLRHLASVNETLPGMAHQVEAAKILINHMLRITDRGAGLHLFVTHDSILLAAAAVWVGAPIPTNMWPRFLDALFVGRSESGPWVSYRGGPVRVFHP